MSRKPPSQRDPEYVPQRMYRALASMRPGTMGGRVANAGLVESATVLSRAVGTAGGPRFWHDDYTVAATPLTAYTLSRTPWPKSVLLAINGSVKRETIDYTVDYTGGVVTVSVPLTTGDKLVARYATVSA